MLSNSRRRSATTAPSYTQYTSRSTDSVARSNHNKSRPPPARSAVSSQAATTTRRRASTYAHTRIDDSPPYVVALLQGKGKGVEVGIAALCLATGHTVMTQIADNSTYHKTIRHLYSYPPNVLLLPDTALQRVSKDFTRNSYGAQTDEHLVERLENEFEIDCIGVDRGHWNRETGRDFVESLAVDDEMKASTLMAMTDKFYALSAASALFKYLQAWKNIEFPERSLRIRYVVSGGTMFVDIDTAKSLELVRNNLTNKTTNTLFHVLNHCHTPMGMRLLRSSILQPSNVAHMIEERLDAVQELLRSQEKLGVVRPKLASVSKLDLDSIIAQISQQKLTIMDVNVTDHRIMLLLNLAEYLQTVVVLRVELAGSHSSLLQAIVKDMSSLQLDQISKIIHDCLSTDVSFSSGRNGKQQNTRISRLFAVKASFAPLLDVARQTYQENLQDIYDLETEVNETYGLDCQLETKGSTFHFTVPLDQMEDVVGPEFIGIEKVKNKARFTSQELLKRSAKLSQSHQEVLLISGQIVVDLMGNVMDMIGDLYQCAEAVAALDLAANFAHAATNHKCVRPEFKNTLAIHSGRHPILDQTLGVGECVPNNVYATEGSANFQIIQGPNMSGKSTYLRQIGLMTVQAMVGSFVPAEYASFILPDALLSRLSNDDSMERCLSTFASEMATSAMILGFATSRSLVLIDELGRGTSSMEGMGISHAIAESLISRKTFVFFATHYQDLAAILGNLPGVVKLHLKVQSDSTRSCSSEFASTFSYKVAEGAALVTHYGLETAKLAALPEIVIQRAMEVATQLTELEEKGKQSKSANATIQRRKVLWELRSKLKQVADTSKLDNVSLGDFLQNLQLQSYSALRGSLMLSQSAKDMTVASDIDDQ